MIAQDWIDRINDAKSAKDALSVWTELASLDHSTDGFKLLLEVHNACSARLVNSLLST